MIGYPAQLDGSQSVDAVEEPTDEREIGGSYVSRRKNPDKRALSQPHRNGVFLYRSIGTVSQMGILRKSTYVLTSELSAPPSTALRGREGAPSLTWDTPLFFFAAARLFVNLRARNVDSTT